MKRLCSLSVFLLLASSICLFFSSDAKAAAAGEEWDYVSVREGAHMFWWLYGINGTIDPTKPLVMWLQGGPGGSSTGFGNFEEIGPLNLSLKRRPFAWTEAANVLFVDNPVGVGYSYVESHDLLTTNVKEIAADLVTLFENFLKKKSIFETTPFYIFCESYGGKMTAAFGVALKEAISAGRLRSNFIGVALGDSWISPVDSVRTWVTYLYALSQIDGRGVAMLNKLVGEIEKEMATGNSTQATALWGIMEDEIEELADGVGFYNVLEHHGNPPYPVEHLARLTRQLGSSNLARLFLRHVAPLQVESLSALMNGPIREKLGIIPKNVEWGAQSGLVFSYQRGDFMKDVKEDVAILLKKDVQVTIYQGELDLIVPTIGTEAWLQTLSAYGLEELINEFYVAPRHPLYPPSGRALRNTGAFVKKYKNLAFYWIMKAGHMVPRDQGEMALEMIRDVISQP